jgi:membrane dipeptidase
VRTWFALEGAGPLAGHPEHVTDWVARGVRSFGLVHTFDNALATSSGAPEPSATGLTPAGREVVRAIFDAGALVDVSHASDAATREVLEIARTAQRPVIATHSNARALADHPRNLSDDLLRSIAASGGVVGLNFHSPFVVRGKRAELADVVAQAAHLVRVMGEDHVALGSDWEGDIRPAKGLADVSRLPALAAALRRAGMSDDVVAKLFHRNAARLLCPPTPTAP